MGMCVFASIRDLCAYFFVCSFYNKFKRFLIWRDIKAAEKIGVAFQFATKSRR